MFGLETIWNKIVLSLFFERELFWLVFGWSDRVILKLFWLKGSSEIEWMLVLTSLGTVIRRSTFHCLDVCN